MVALALGDCSSRSPESEVKDDVSSNPDETHSSMEEPSVSVHEESDDGSSKDSPPSVEDSGEEESEETEDKSPGDCEIPTYPDDIVIEDDRSASFVEKQLGNAIRGVAVPRSGGSVVCGDGFAVFVGDDGKMHEPLRDASLSGRCVGISTLGEDQLVVAMHQGILLQLELSSKGNLKIVDINSQKESRYFGIAIEEKRDDEEQTIWLAAGRDGVMTYTCSEGVLSRGDVVPGAKDARAVVQWRDSLLVADGYKQGTDEDPTVGGAEIRLLAANGTGVVDEVGNLQGIAMGVSLRGNRALILRPGYGVDVFEVDEKQLVLLHSLVMDGYPADVAWIDETSFLVAAGSMVLRYALNGSEAILVSTELRPDRGELLGGWFRGVWNTPTGIRALTDHALLSLRLGEGIASPQIRLDESTATLAAGQSERIVLLRNQGRAPLVVSDASVANPFSIEISADDNEEKPGCPGQFVLPPDDVLLTWLRFEGKEVDPIAEPLSFRSNDPSMADFEVTAEVHRSAPKVGEPLEDFSMMTVEGGKWQLSDHKERIIIAKLYNPS